MQQVLSIVEGLPWTTPVTKPIQVKGRDSDRAPYPSVLQVQAVPGSRVRKGIKLFPSSPGLNR